MRGINYIRVSSVGSRVQGFGCTSTLTWGCVLESHTGHSAAAAAKAASTSAARMWVMSLSIAEDVWVCARVEWVLVLLEPCV